MTFVVLFFSWYKYIRWCCLSVETSHSKKIKNKYIKSFWESHHPRIRSFIRRRLISIHIRGYIDLSQTIITARCHIRFLRLEFSWIPSSKRTNPDLVVIVPISQCHFENWKWWYSTLCQQSADIKKALFVRISHTACALARIYGHVRHVRPTREILLRKTIHIYCHANE